MRILLAKDSNLNLDINFATNILSKICKNTWFVPYVEPIDINQQSAYINYAKERNIIRDRLDGDAIDHSFYVTSRRYKNNYFFYSSDVTILSFYGWQYYTTLPIENGLFYFIAQLLALNIDNSFRHEETTGCIYDFLGNKTAVDLGMKTGRICDECNRKLTELTNHAISKKHLLDDVNKILAVLSRASNLEQSVFEFDRESTIFNWSSFEDEVAKIYKKYGFNVIQNINLAGFHIDVLIEKIEKYHKKKVLIECKFSKNSVNDKTVYDFIKKIDHLKKTSSIDSGIIVSYSGFTPKAKSIAQNTNIELVNFKDLKTKFGKKLKIDLKNQSVKVLETLGDENLKTALDNKVKSQEKLQKKKLEIQNNQLSGLDAPIALEKTRLGGSADIFVLIPFNTEMEDVYLLGISDTIKHFKCSCDKADTIKFVGPILEKIFDCIKNSRVIVAEVTKVNANVYYELGYAHAMGKPTILITKDIKTSPFDTKGYNHIIYKNITDLKRQLKDLLEAILIDNE